MKEEKKLFRTVLNGKVSWVYERPGFKHELGKDNGCPEDRWILDDINEQWIPYIDIGINRPCWEVHLVQDNKTKYKWDKTRIDSTCVVSLVCNKEEVFSFRCRDLNYGLSRANVLITEFSEHPFDFSNPIVEVGRKIWYYNQPAKLIEILSGGDIMLEYSGEKDGFDLRMPWDSEPDDCSYWNGKKKVKTSIIDENIYWFRN